jgi:hypothetical protein
MLDKQTALWLLGMIIIYVALWFLETLLHVPEV